MAKKHVADGKVLQYTPGTAKSSGDVVAIGKRIGVCITDIAANATGAISVEGVWELTKQTPDSIGQGDEVYWDSGAAKITSVISGNLKAGYAVETAGSNATTVKVKINA